MSTSLTYNKLRDQQFPTLIKIIIEKLFGVKIHLIKQAFKKVIILKFKYIS